MTASERDNHQTRTNNALLSNDISYQYETSIPLDITSGVNVVWACKQKRQNAMSVGGTNL